MWSEPKVGAPGNKEQLSGPRKSTEKTLIGQGGLASFPPKGDLSGQGYFPPSSHLKPTPFNNLSLNLLECNIFII